MDNIYSQSYRPGGFVDEKAGVWLKRIEIADKYYEKWAQRFKCSKLEQYYEGQQWEPSGTNYEPYTINLVFGTIEIKLPTLLFQSPQYHIKPKPSGVQYDLEDAIKRSQLREDLLNTLVTDHLIGFGEEVEEGIVDAFFRFGVVEVGYDADWVVNPNAGKPILRSDDKPYVDDNKNVIKQPDQVPQSEKIYVRRIFPDRFRVGGLDASRLDRCNWCGYYEWVRVEDLKANKNLRNTDKLDWSGGRSPDFLEGEEFMDATIDSLTRSGDLIKVWHIFDIRKKTRYLIAYPQGIILRTLKFKRLPLFAIRFHKRRKGWYPMPPVFNWKSPQDEYNEAREQLRNHRKRFIRKYIYKTGAFPVEEELDKLMNGGDGSFVATPGETDKAVTAVPNADLGASSMQALGITRDDFNIISATTQEERNQTGDRTTATQANIVNQKAAIRDSRSKLQIAKWLQDIGREILLLAEEKLTLPIWVKMEVPPGQFLQNVTQIQHIWQQITQNDLKQSKDGELEDDFNFDVSISLDSMSPIEEGQDKQNFLTFLAVIAQYPEVSADPLLFRETAYKLGYRNEKVIERMQQIAQLILVQKLSALSAQANATSGAAGGAGTPQMAQQTIANAQGPTMENITNQLKNQLGFGVPVQ